MSRVTLLTVTHLMGLMRDCFRAELQVVLLITETAIAPPMGQSLQYTKSSFMLPAHSVVLPSLRSLSFFTAVS